MIRLNWKQEDLSIRRLVIPAHSLAGYLNSLLPVARFLDVDIADETVEPRPNDFWLGCSPQRGWGDADPSVVGWASIVEVPIAVKLILALAPRPSTQASSIARQPIREELPYVVRFA